MPLVFGGVGVQPSTRGQPTIWYDLQAGAVDLIPAGQWALKLDGSCVYQEYDQITGIWRPPGGDKRFGGGSMLFVQSDGVNHRVANQSGCVVGALVSNGGSGYLSPPTVTSSLGSGAFTAIVGGAIGTSITVVNGGQSYSYPPLVAFSAPPFPGVPATGYATISGGVVTGVTVVDQGAGYTGGAPTISFLNDPRDTTGYGAAASCVVTGAGTVTAVLANDHGSPVANNTTALPTFTISGGSGSGAASIAIMNWGLTSFTITTAGTGQSATGLVSAVGLGTGLTGTASAILNPSVQANLVRTRQGLILPTMSGGAISAVGTVVDPGVYAGNNFSIQVLGNAAPTAAPSLTVPAFSGTNGLYGLLPV